jgi:hypothetical protein
MANIIQLHGNYPHIAYALQAYFADRNMTYKQGFKESTCILPISIWQSEREEDNLRATLELISRSFKACSLFMYDIVQRYSFAISHNKDEDAFFDFCKDEGYRWIHKNSDIIETSLTIPYQITRWNNWMKHHRYQYFHKKIISLYDEDTEYRASINAAIKLALDTMTRRGQVFDMDKGTKLYTKYIIEECTILCLWAMESLSFIVNIGSEATHIRMTREKIINHYYHDMLKPVSVRFRKYNNKQENNKNFLLRAA